MVAVAVVVGVAALFRLTGDDRPPEAEVGADVEIILNEFVPLEITEAFLFSDTRLVLGVFCPSGRLDGKIVESTPRAVRVRVEGLFTSDFCQGAGFEELELSEPVNGRLVIDDVTGRVVWDGRIWHGMPLLAVTDDDWQLLDARLPPLLPDPPTPLDLLRWALTYERDGVEVVVESYTDTAAEVSAAIDDPDDVVVDTAPGWAVRVTSAEPTAAVALEAALVPMSVGEWFEAIGQEWILDWPPPP